MPLLYVALGGAFGSMGRYLVASAVGHALGNSFPYGTLTVNVIGSFLMGVLTGALVDLLPGNNELRLLIGVGLAVIATAAGVWLAHHYRGRR